MCDNVYMQQLEIPKNSNSITIPRYQFYGALALCAVVAFVGGSTMRGSVPFASLAAVHDSRAPENVDLAPLFVAWNLLEKNFAPSSTTTPVSTSEQKLYGAIGGLARAYGDDYTVFFPPKEKEQFDTAIRGDFEGVGMEIGIRNGVLTVVSPIKGTPAMRAGLLSGDRILKIDDKSSEGLQVEEAVSLIRGPKGTTVVLYISRESKDGGKPYEVKVVRDKIDLPTIDAKLRDDGVFTIQLYNFNQNSAQLFAQAVDSFARSGSDKLVIDLRNNPGGYLESAVDMASWFLPQGALVVSEDYGKKRESDVYKSHGYSVLNGRKVSIVVLINKGSASASEILTGALMDHGLATVVGEQSFGKGSVQQLFDVTDKTSIKITIARWLTPKGTSISHHGITPNIVVERTEKDMSEGKDPQLDRAVQFLLTGK